MAEKQWVEVPVEEIPKDTLVELVQSFVLREGTDYGMHEATLEAKVNSILTQLGRGTSIVVFDNETDSCTILSQVEYKQRQTVGTSNGHKELDQTR